MSENEFENSILMEEKKSFDNFFLGLFGSFLMTLVTIMLVTNNNSNWNNLDVALKQIYDHPQYLDFLTAALIPSMVVFFVFYKTERWQSGKGLIVAVLITMITVAFK